MSTKAFTLFLYSHPYLHPHFFVTQYRLNKHANILRTYNIRHIYVIYRARCRIAEAERAFLKTLNLWDYPPDMKWVVLEDVSFFIDVIDFLQG